ncbi:MAG: trypsin-like serine protease, partial [Polyangiales bacterium]
HIVGFGQTGGGSDSAGVKHEGDTSVSEVGSNLIRSDVGAGTCQGDSGGPAFDSSNRVTGITSFGFGGCTLSGSSFYTRVAKHTALIEDALTFEPPCEDTGFESCDGVDNDCDGVVDEGCTALGEPCSTDDECSNGRCEAVDGEDVCVRECDPRFRIPMCPVGFYCEATGCGVGRCLAGGEGSKDAGEECADDIECKSRNCADVNGTMRCGRQCADGEGDPCDTDQACEVRDDGCGSCVPVELSTGPRSFGAPCESDDQCESMDCADDGICTGPCSDSDPCPSGFHCRTGSCVRGELGDLGAPCVHEDDCSSMAPECVETEGEKLCVSECDGSGGCLSDFECRETSVGERCVPPGKPLGESCSENGECRSGICAGTCTRLCDTEACPDGFVCEPAGEHQGCFPDSGGTDAGTGGGGGGSGGCSASAGTGAAGGAAAVWLVVMVVATRRWPRRRR